MKITLICKFLVFILEMLIQSDPKRSENRKKWIHSQLLSIFIEFIDRSIFFDKSRLYVIELHENFLTPSKNY